MRRILTKVLIFYWTTAFSAMAYACIADQGRGIGRAFHLLGASPNLTSVGETGSVVLAGVLAVAFTLGAVLFLWSLITGWTDSIASRGADDVLRLAFAFGCVVFAALLVIAGFFSISGIFAAVTLHLIAMLTSYLAIHAERTSVVATPKDVEVGRQAQFMAANAARQYSRVKLAVSNVHPIRGDR